MCIILWISLFLGFLSESISNLFEVGTGYLFPGGGHGHFVSVWLNSLVGRIGTMLILILTFIAILFFGFERTFYKCVDYIKEQIRRHQEKALAALAEREARAAAAVKKHNGKPTHNKIPKTKIQQARFRQGERRRRTRGFSP